MSRGRGTVPGVDTRKRALCRSCEERKTYDCFPEGSYMAAAKCLECHEADRVGVEAALASSRTYGNLNNGGVPETIAEFKRRCADDDRRRDDAIRRLEANTREALGR